MVLFFTELGLFSRPRDAVSHAAERKEKNYKWNERDFLCNNIGYVALEILCSHVTYIYMYPTRQLEKYNSEAKIERRFERGIQEVLLPFVKVPNKIIRHRQKNVREHI